MAQKTPDVKFKIEGEQYELNIEELEFGEVELIEEEFDLPLEEIDLRRVKALRVLAFIAMKRRDSAVTMDKIRHIKVASLEDVAEEAQGNGDRPTQRKASRKQAGA